MPSNLPPTWTSPGQDRDRGPIAIAGWIGQIDIVGIRALFAHRSSKPARLHAANANLTPAPALMQCCIAAESFALEGHS